MAARLDSVCRFICERGDWKVTNLQLQKILYLAQMLHMGRNDGDRLVQAQFEAWDYGPVEPSLYKKIRMYGSGPVKDVFYDAGTFKDNDIRKATLDEVCDVLLSMRPGQLVDITHWENGAWAKHYLPGVRGVQIPDKDIVEEYKKRVG